VAWRLVEAFRAPFPTPLGELFCTASIGVAVSQADSEPADLLREADTAMYAAKNDGRDRVAVFNNELREAVTARRLIESDLRHALERDQLAVWFQPEVDLVTGRVIAAEALLRWHHPSGDTLTAARFIDVAEETGLINDIGDWVLQQACTQATSWATGTDDRPITVRVNVSARQLAEGGLLDVLDDALATTSLDPNLLCLEITETALLSETRIARDNLTGIHDRGVRIAIDDFGTGYASLSYLHRYPIDVVKIDRSFITGIATEQHDYRLVGALIAMANHLQLSVTAEGVEDEHQADRLRALNCPSAQGYLYSQAIPPEQFVTLLATVFPHP
jgi:EAL domain-containing protein (putative c-di-GMP-specific phosphodiesterase class I)